MVQLQKERDNVTKLYAQINTYEQNINCLKTELSAVYKEETKYFIDKWLKEKFGIENQKEAREKSIFIVFDKSGNFIKTVTTGNVEEFRYVSSIEDNNTLLMCSKWKGEEIMYTLGCIACFGFVVVIIAALLDL